MTDSLPSVREICRRLDGLPLAIELVAARLVVLPPNRVLQALDEGLALEMEGPVDLPERQRTLRAAIAWSYGLLSDGQKELHDALGAFAGGCTLEDARAVSHSGPAFFRDLEALVAWSLVRSDIEDGDVRLSMLETVREDAVARLHERGALDQFRRRHAERFVALSLSAEAELAAGPGQADWLELLERELDNIRTALDWCLSSARAEDALRAISALDRFWRAHAHVGEARRWLSLGLALTGDVSENVRGAALLTAARLAAAQSDWNASAASLEEAIEIFARAGRGRDEVTALSFLSFVALRRDELEQAGQSARRALALAQEGGDPATTSKALMACGDVSWTEGAYSQAIAQYEEAVELVRGLDDPLLLSDAVYNLGMAAFQGGNVDRARSSFEEAQELARSLGDVPHLAAAQFMLASLDLASGDNSAAVGRARESYSLYASLGDDRSCARNLVVLAGAAAADGAFEEAARLTGAADSLRGNEQPDEFERPVLDGYLARLESMLGPAQSSRLKSAGRGLRSDVILAEVVSLGVEE